MMSYTLLCTVVLARMAASRVFSRDSAIFLTRFHALASAMELKKSCQSLCIGRQGLTPMDFIVAGRRPFTDEQVDKLSLRTSTYVCKASLATAPAMASHASLREELPAALELAGEQGERILIEESMGTEITVPVIGNENPTALPIVEIVTGDEFCWCIKTNTSLHLCIM